MQGAVQHVPQGSEGRAGAPGQGGRRPPSAPPQEMGPLTGCWAWAGAWAAPGADCSLRGLVLRADPARSRQSLLSQQLCGDVASGAVSPTPDRDWPTVGRAAAGGLGGGRGPRGVVCGRRHVVLLWARASPASCPRWPALGAPGSLWALSSGQLLSPQVRCSCVTVPSALLSGTCRSCRWKGPCGTGEAPTPEDRAGQRQSRPQGALSPFLPVDAGASGPPPRGSSSPRSLGPQEAASDRRAEPSGPGRSGLLHCVTRGALAVVTFKVMTSFK